VTRVVIATFLFPLTLVLSQSAATASAPRLSTWFAGSPAITQNYGCTSFSVEALAAPAHTCPSSARYWHTGVDIGLKCGTPIYAPVRVTVVSIGAGGTATTGTGPYYPQVQLVDGTTVILGHAERPVVLHPGEVVAPGGLLAYSGGGPGTGASDGCHLHFEVHPPGGGGFGSGTDINPMSTLTITANPPGSSNLIVVRSGTTLLARAGVEGPWTVQSTWLATNSPIFCADNLIGYIGAKGTLWVKQGLNGTWIDETNSADAAVITSNGRIVVRSGGTLMAKNSPSSPWVTEATWLAPSSPIYAAGNLIGYVGAKGTLWVKAGLGGVWTDETDSADDVLISPSGWIVVRSGSDLLAKTSMNAPWVTEATWLTTNTPIYSAGDLLAFIGPQRTLWVKEGVSGAWHNESTADDVVLSANGTIVARSGSVVKVKESLSSSWVTEYRWLTATSTIFASDDLFGYVGATGTMWVKSDVESVWLYETGLVSAVQLDS
jgi:hypothetical protein